MTASPQTAPKPHVSEIPEPRLKITPPVAELIYPTHHNVPISVDEQKTMAGDVIDRFSVDPEDPNKEYAPFGYFVALDEDGRPTGPVTPDRPTEGPYASVALAQPIPPDVLVTPTGAPLTEHMNPSHIQYDAGMQERNPSSPPPTMKDVEAGRTAGPTLSAKAPSKEKHMKATYQGKPVEVIRPARSGDKDYKAGTEQSVIRLEDGTEKTVPKSEVTESK